MVLARRGIEAAPASVEAWIASMCRRWNEKHTNPSERITSDRLAQAVEGGHKTLTALTACLHLKFGDALNDDSSESRE